MSLKIFKAGILDSVQDMGRYGQQHLGINPGGVMDRFAAHTANLLVGNDPAEAVIELHFPAAVFIFEKPALIALAGADFSATINGELVPVHHPILVNRNSFLQFHRLNVGARVYLSVRGGFDLEPWLNSRSTHLKAMMGGHQGRALQKDDQIRFRSTENYFPKLAEKEFIVLPWSADPGPYPKNEVMVLEGNEWNRLTTESKENFYMSSFVITQQSDRMGYRLNHHPLPSLTNSEILSTGVSFGTVQLLPDGKLIILMADHQTTGGYPRIAHVISAHLPRLAQMKAGDKLKFQMTDLQTAENLLRKQQQHLLQLRNACTFRLPELLNA